MVAVAKAREVQDAASSWSGHRRIRLLLRHRRRHPLPSSNRSGEVAPQGLSPEEYLLVMYEIRNSWIDGNRGTRSIGDLLREAFTDSLVGLMKQLL